MCRRLWRRGIYPVLLGYDVMVALILAFILLIPGLFRYEPCSCSLSCWRATRASMFRGSPEVLEGTPNPKALQVNRFDRKETGPGVTLVRLDTILDAEK